MPFVIVNSLHCAGGVVEVATSKLPLAPPVIVAGLCVWESFPTTVAPGVPVTSPARLLVV